MRPYALVAELSYRCPLACAYCSNPLDFAAHADELTTDEWIRVVHEAEQLGVVQLHLSGGEPLVRRDLEAIIASAKAAGLYTHLVTSGIPLDAPRVVELVRAGLDAVQVSLQGTGDDDSERFAGLRCHDRKLDAIRWFQVAGRPVTINVVLHRGNIARVADIIDLAVSLGVRRLELANVQTLGWALRNRDALLPDAAAIEHARSIAFEAKRRLAGQMEIVLVLPDYFRGRPRACMGGWAARTIVIDPTGVALPCHAARSITTLDFADVRSRSLAWIWNESPAFQRFRGEAWMPEPCKSCPEREHDHGGCRCQAFALTGDAARTDPACDRSPDHGVVLAARLTSRTETPSGLLQLRSSGGHRR